MFCRISLVFNTHVLGTGGFPPAQLESTDDLPEAVCVLLAPAGAIQNAFKELFMVGSRQLDRWEFQLEE